MEVLKVIVTIIYVLICVALAVIVLMQEGESDGLSGAIGGQGAGADTYWSKNKGRSKEGAVERTTKYLAFLFIALSVVLNLM